MTSGQSLHLLVDLPFGEVEEVNVNMKTCDENLVDCVFSVAEPVHYLPKSASQSGSKRDIGILPPLPASLCRSHGCT